MRKMLSFVLIILVTTVLNAQVFNTANTLNKGKFSATGAPVFYDGGMMLMGKVGYGLKYGNDLAVTMGFGDISYLGIDAEKVLSWDKLDNLTISFASGVHYSKGFGLDGTLNLSVPLDKSLVMYGGVDMDLMLTGNTGLPLYLFIGAEYNLKNRLTILGEVDLGVNDAGNMLGIGVCYYFNGIQIK